MLYALNSLTTISETLITNNIANTAGIVLLNGGTLNSYETLVVNNKAITAVIALTSCVANFIGNTTLMNNIGSLLAADSDVTLEGNINIADSMPFTDDVIPIQEGGAVTIFQSFVRFNGTMNLMNNFAENGGAILATESTVFMYGQVIIAKNNACLLYTSPSPRDATLSRMPSSA